MPKGTDFRTRPFSFGGGGGGGARTGFKFPNVKGDKANTTVFERASRVRSKLGRRLKEGKASPKRAAELKKTKGRLDARLMDTFMDRLSDVGKK